MDKRILLLISLITILIFVGVFLVISLNINQESAIYVNEISYPVSNVVFSSDSLFSQVIDDFSCQPSECPQLIEQGINSIQYPICNSKVQVNNTGASSKTACDYWKIQEEYFGTEDYVDLSEISKKNKLLNSEPIVDGYLGLDYYIPIHRNALEIFLKAEENFNKLYGANRIGSTYYLPSYPNGYTFEFGGSLNKRAISGSKENLEGLLFEGNYITPSSHFWGVALDLNSTTNSGNRLKADSCVIDIPPEIVKVFEDTGLRWGGRFMNDAHTIMDPMHFEYVPRCIK